MEGKEVSVWGEEMTQSASVVTLNVGGYLFTTTIATLTRFSDTMLGAMFSGRHAFSHTQDKNGAFFIDRDGRHFHEILNFLRGSMACTPESMAQQLSSRALEELKVGSDFSNSIHYVPSIYISPLQYTLSTLSNTTSNTGRG